MTVTWSLSQLFSQAGHPPEVNADVERWRTLLHWAAQTPYYWRQSGMFAEAAVRDSVTAIRSELNSIKPVELDWFLKNAAKFRSGYTRLVAPQRCSSFWETKAKIALVRPWFRTEEPARSFPGPEPLSKTAKSINRFEPDVLVAPTGHLVRLVRTAVEPPRRALIAIQSPGMNMIREADRELLWQRFKVPLYQQLRGFQGELLATECDAQVGFHANEATAHWEVRRQMLLYTSFVDLRHPVLRLASGWSGDLETSRCGCGCLSLRIFPYERQRYNPQLAARGVA